MTSTMMKWKWWRKVHNIVNRRRTYPSTGTSSISIYLCSLSAAIFSRFLLAWPAVSRYEIFISKRTSLNSAVSTLLDPGSFFLPSICFRALLLVSLTLLQHLSSPTWSYMSLSGSKLFWLCLLLFHASDLPPWFWWSPKSPGKGFSLLWFFHTTAVELQQKSMTGTHRGLVLVSISSI